MFESFAEKKQLKELLKKYKEYIDAQEFSKIVKVCEEIICLMEARIKDANRLRDSYKIVPYYIKQAMALQAVIASEMGHKGMGLPILSVENLFGLRYGNDACLMNCEFPAECFKGGEEDQECENNEEHIDQLEEEDEEECEEDEGEEEFEEDEEEEEEEEIAEDAEESREIHEDVLTEANNGAEKPEEKAATDNTNSCEKEDNDEKNDDDDFDGEDEEEEEGEEEEEEYISPLDIILTIFKHVRDILDAQSGSVKKSDKFCEYYKTFFVSLARFFFLINEFEKSVECCKNALVIIFKSAVHTNASEEIGFIYFVLLNCYIQMQKYEDAAVILEKVRSVYKENERHLRREIRNNVGKGEKLRLVRNTLREKLLVTKAKTEQLTIIEKFVRDGLKTIAENEALENGEDVEISDGAEDSNCEDKKEESSNDEYVEAPVTNLPEEE